MNDLTSLQELDALVAAPGALVLYKHSTQCGMCDTAISEVEAFEKQHPAVPVHYLDLLAHRDVSNAVASKLGIRHESPQAIVLKDGKVAGVLNHRKIRAAELSVLISASQK